MGLLMLNGNIYTGFNEPPTIYSDEEREIGVWRDGKPLYQKTLNGTMATSYVNIDVSSLNIDKLLFNPAGSVKVSSSSGSNVYLGYYVSASDRFNAYYDAANTRVRVQAVDSNYVGPFWITICYTKTTDSAGSGKWTTSGVPTHHYSTTEQIIGTWIDGKPLYEKTIDFGALPNNTSKNVNHNISNLDYIVSAVGYAVSPGVNSIPIPFVNNTSVGSQVAVITTSSVITVRTNDDRSNYTKCYITLQYTKTTD